ncbi:MAG: AmmeMemoRadiSam system protein B [Candidatus Buchananbacteria bacterium]|nr:AmmeMemoRadiSam system protein B [Candidatus Buchananbacteria bacterium]
MPIVFAAITPHPPVLIPKIGKDNLKKLKKTEEAMKSLEQQLYAAKPESILIVSPHGQVFDESFNINFSAEYKSNFKDFGDFELELSFKSDYMSIQEIRAADESNQEAPVVMTSPEELDYGFSVPLYFLTQHLKNIPIIPITHSGLDYQQHFKFGNFLYRELSRINKRFAVIASADLAHTLTKDAPGGYSEKAKEFDQKVVTAIKKKDFAALQKISPAEAAEVKEDGLRSLIILSGVLESLNIEPEILSYEGPFGVGYLVSNFKLL